MWQIVVGVLMKLWLVYRHIYIYIYITDSGSPSGIGWVNEIGCCYATNRNPSFYAKYCHNNVRQSVCVYVCNV